MTRKLFSILALLCLTALSAWAAETYTVKIEANGNSIIKENVTLPYTFSCNYTGGNNGELDQIIQQLYGRGSNCEADTTPTASGNDNVTAGKDGWSDYFTISAPFEGTATVTGTYVQTGDWDDEWFTYTLTISIPDYTATPEEPALTFADALAAGEPCTIEDILIPVAHDGTYCYVTDGGGNWARLAGFPAEQFDPTLMLHLTGAFAIEDGMPTITLASTDDIIGTIENEPFEPDMLDLTVPMTAETAPKTCQVIRVSGYYYNGRLYAYSGKNGTLGQGISVEGADLTKGTQYNATVLIKLLEPWESEASGAPRRVKPGDFHAFDNIKATILDVEEVDTTTGINDVNAAAGAASVRYYNLQGVESATPFDGLNIVVTKHADGSATATKVIK